jgi:glycerol-3-phosphate acyltransferase PlsY
MIISTGGVNFMVWPFCILGGYLFGSVSPSYILGKVLKGIDIRQHGTRNAGTINAYKLLGLWPAVITATFDLSKGLLAMYLCYLAGGSPLFVHLAGVAAVLGHVFPFYLRFRGGQGVATATAILIYYLVVFYTKGWLPPASLLLLAVGVISFGYIGRKEEIVALVILPLLSVLILVFSPYSPSIYFILSIIAYILFINILNIWSQKLLDIPSLTGKGVIGWRLYIRPLAFLLIVYYLHAEKKSALTLIGSITLFFLLLDLMRLLSQKINIFFFYKVKQFYREKEYRKFSSITIFLLAYFLTVLLFEKSIAVLAVSYLTFGDFFSKFFGLLFGRKKLFEKSLEGSLAHLNACLATGAILLHFDSIPLLAYFLGAFIATLSEVLPLGIDDNFSVSLLSAATMYVFRLFK